MGPARDYNPIAPSEPRMKPNNKSNVSTSLTQKSRLMQPQPSLHGIPKQSSMQQPAPASILPVAHHADTLHHLYQLRHKTQRLFPLNFGLDRNERNMLSRQDKAVQAIQQVVQTPLSDTDARAMLVATDHARTTDWLNSEDDPSYSDYDDCHSHHSVPPQSYPTPHLQFRRLRASPASIQNNSTDASPTETSPQRLLVPQLLMSCVHHSKIVGCCG